jgi:hypothetical protein
VARRKVLEIGTTGVDEFLQGLTSSAYPNVGNPSFAGLRVPTVVTPPAGQAVPRYLFCLATFLATGKTRIRGIRQGLKIGCDTASGTPPMRLLEGWVKTPDWRFSDGNVSWHLVREPSQPLVVQPPLTDTQSWIKRQSQGGPAMLYETFTNSNVNPQTGAPVIYCQGLTAYTAPNVATNWTDVGGLGTMYDMRFPWNSDNAWNCLDIPVDPGKYTLYASILQTNPSTRTNAVFQTVATTGTNNIANSVSDIIPEEALIADFTGEATAAEITYTRVFGSIIVEIDEDEHEEIQALRRELKRVRKDLDALKTKAGA